MTRKKFAKKIRQIRTEKLLTQEWVASRTGFSKAFISKIENGITAPSIASLSKIAVALGVGISTLFDGNTEENEDLVIIRRNQRKEVVGPGTDIGFAYESLAYKKKNKSIEPFVIKYPPGSHAQKLFEHDGEEMIFILQGKIKFIYGDRTYLLGAGDTAYFNPAIPHRGESVGKEEGIGLCVLVPPSKR
ncbi:MAG: cupin domain-containing protein [Deltaproteobacteria bacterium]|nr:cupin domain-containing protein [Deltaproteobacteria bacterium]